MLTIAAITTFLAGLAATLGPFALMASPAGAVMALVGGRADSRMIKTLAIIAGLVLLIGGVAGVTVHVQHLKRDAEAGRKLAARDASIEKRFGCPARPLYEQPLDVCLTAIEAEKQGAIAETQTRQNRTAAAEQDRETRATTALRAAQDIESAAIDAGAGGDVDDLLAAWGRERARRGVK